MDDMIANIGMEYDLGSGDQHPLPEVQNFYKLLVVSGEKVHDGTELTVLQVVMYLMGMKSKYNFSNQCYNDIMKLIIDLIPVKHNMPKFLYQSKMIVVGLGMNYEMKELWQGVDAYDSHPKCQFNLRVAYLWSIHDYLAYGKFVGSCVHGRLNCPICMNDTDAFRL
jgi:hypothetical protein